jgi:glycosidase
VLHLHQGTPYVYQGDELGMANAPFAAIGDFRDIQTLNYYAQAAARGDVDLAALLPPDHPAIWAFLRRGAGAEAPPLGVGHLAPNPAVGLSRWRRR